MSLWLDDEKYDQSKALGLLGLYDFCVERALSYEFRYRPGAWIVHGQGWSFAVTDTEVSYSADLRGLLKSRMETASGERNTEGPGSRE